MDFRAISETDEGAAAAVAATGPQNAVLQNKVPIPATRGKLFKYIPIPTVVLLMENLIFYSTLFQCQFPHRRRLFPQRIRFQRSSTRKWPPVNKMSKSKIFPFKFEYLNAFSAMKNIASDITSSGEAVFH